MAPSKHVELKVERCYGDPKLPVVCSILHVGRRRFVLEWMMGRDGLLWTVTTSEKRDIKRFVEKWRDLAGRLAIPLVIHRSTSEFLS
jgi:hypothetical protein